MFFVPLKLTTFIYSILLPALFSFGLLQRWFLQNSNSIHMLEGFVYIPQLLSPHLWHHHLGHPSVTVLSHLGSSKFLFANLRFQTSFCKGCAFGKSIRLPFASSNEIKIVFAFALIHSDVWQSHALSTSRFKYCVFTNDYTRNTQLYLIKNKYDVFHHFHTFVSYVQTQFYATIQQFQSDGRDGYDNFPFRTFRKA